MTATAAEGLPGTAVAALRRTVEGAVAYPADPAYDEQANSAPAALRHRPDAVVTATSEDDLAAAVAVAGAHGLRVRVQATGHGATVAHRGGLLLLTHRLDGIDIDLRARTATVQCGVTWGALADAAARHGLAPVTTNAPGVSVVGSVLGGGLGPQARHHGLCSDQVESLHVVRADGYARTVPAGSEVGWALLGGRDGLGIVSRMTVRLDGAPTVWGAEVDLADPGPALAAWLTWSRALPPIATTTAKVVDGGSVLRVNLCLTEPADIDGPFVFDRSGTTTAAGWLRTYGDHGIPGTMLRRGHLLDHPADLDAAVGPALVELAGPDVSVELRGLGGALDRPSRHAADLGGASHLIAVLAPRAAQLPRLPTLLDKHLVRSGLVNFHGVAAADHPLDRCWPGPIGQQLAQTRRAEDPLGLFAPHPTEQL